MITRYFSRYIMLRTLFLFGLSILLIQQATAQYRFRVRKPSRSITTSAKLDALSTNKDSVQTSYQYSDGLGRTLQKIIRRASPAGNDIIVPYAYGVNGREEKSYLPYVSTSTSYGSYRSDALTPGQGVAAFYNPSGGNTEGNRVGGIVLTPAPVSQRVYESSPLNRVIEQGAAGLAWQVTATPDTDHTKRLSFTSNDQTASFSTTNVSATNLGSRKAALYKAIINANGSRALLRAGNTATYPSGALTVSIFKDENWAASNGCFGTVEEYRDKENHVVLKRSYNISGTTAQMLSTYYVYDDFGLLAYVLPPGTNPDATTAITQATLDTKAYQYRYDSRGRLNQKKMPGKGWEFSIYNKLDRVIATQDSVQRMKAPQEWTVAKYDALGRPLITGVYQYGSVAGVNNRATVQIAADAVTACYEAPITTGNGYTNNAWPAILSATLSLNYYDDYSSIPGLPALYNLAANSLYSKLTKGQVTATKTLVLNTTGDYLWTVPYYDNDGQVIRLLQQHYLGGASALSSYNYDDVAVILNFNKQPTLVRRRHYTSNAGTSAVLKLTKTDVLTYDHVGRLLAVRDTLRDGSNIAQTPVTISKITYNELGQSIKKGLHSLNGTNFLQNIDYRYNPQGWLTNINNAALTNDAGVTSADATGNDQFGMEFKYENAVTPQYNGNVGYSKTLTGSLSGTVFPSLTYNYKYDKLNRITNAISTTAANNDNFHNENLSYDVAGNILKLNRYDKVNNIRTVIDSLTYTYSGYQQTRIDDAAANTAGFADAVQQTNEYTYDGNGNQLKDLNKGLSSMSYNMLNTTQNIVKTDGSTVAYVYDASGRKLRKLFTSGGVISTTEYINGIQYEYTGSTPAIAFVTTNEGRARKSGSVYKYEYDLRDHLGNTRVTLTWNSTDAVNQTTPLMLQRNDYYAFGHAIASSSGITNPKNEYLYNRKELQEETGLYDYGARQYDPIIGKWTGVDLLAEKHVDISPYNYVLNNPINFTDPIGLDTAGTKSDLPFTFTGNNFLNEVTVTAPPKVYFTYPTASSPQRYYFQVPPNKGPKLGQMRGPADQRRSPISGQVISKGVMKIVTPENVNMYYGWMEKGKVAAELLDFERSARIFTKMGSEHAPVIGALKNYIDVKQNKITMDEYKYKQAGHVFSFGAGAIVGAEFGGPWGFGAGFVIDYGWEKAGAFSVPPPTPLGYDRIESGFASGFN